MKVGVSEETHHQSEAVLWKDAVASHQSVSLHAGQLRQPFPYRLQYHRLADVYSEGQRRIILVRDERGQVGLWHEPERRVWRLGCLPSLAIVLSTAGLPHFKHPPTHKVFISPREAATHSPPASAESIGRYHYCISVTSGAKHIAAA